MIIDYKINAKMGFKTHKHLVIAFPNRKHLKASKAMKEKVKAFDYKSISCHTLKELSSLDRGGGGVSEL